MPLRITGGLLRGRNVPSPSTFKTRPTASRTREALFNILQSVENFNVLDLFAGSGIIGIEALSRGAKSVTAVEMSHTQAILIKNAYAALSLNKNLTLFEKDALNLPIDSLNKFNLIYADPPFKGMPYPDLRKFYSHLALGGVAVFEAPTKNLPEWANECDQIRKYGESSLLMYWAK